MKLRDKPTFGTGVTHFAVDLGLSRETLDSFLDKLDSVGIPTSNGRVVEIMVAHNPDAGVDLDNPDANYLTWGKDLGKELKDRGYGTLVLGFHPPGSPDLLSDDSDEFTKAENRVYRMIDFAEALGADTVAGPFHREHMKHRDDGRDSDYLIDPLKRIGEYAAAKDKLMAIEMLNRFETDSCNNIDATSELLSKLPISIGMHYDTAHAIREEPVSHNLASSVERAYDTGRLYHVHFSAAGRGPLEFGEVVTEQIPRIVEKLTEKGYNGKACFEGFPYDLWGAVRRTDNLGAGEMSDDQRNELNLNETKASMKIIRSYY